MTVANGRTWAIRGTCLILWLLTASGALAAQSNTKAHAGSLPGANWRSIAALPDWGGAWYLQTGGQFSRGGVAGALPPRLTDAGAAELKKADHDYFDEGVNPPLQNCHPDGMPHIMDYAFPMAFYFTPGEVTVYLEAYGQVRWIYTDGRKHPEDLPPTYDGDSIGHWQGRTLVVDTIGMLPQTQLVISNNFLGIRHSDKLRLTERMRLTAEGNLGIGTDKGNGAGHGQEAVGTFPEARRASSSATSMMRSSCPPTT